MQALVLGLMLVAVAGTPVLGFAQTKSSPRPTKGTETKAVAPKAAETKGAKVEDAAPGGEGHAVKDSWLTTKTALKLFADNRVKAGRISVDTHAGVVTLRGKVETAEERATAEAIARTVDGVRSVTNALQIVPIGQRRLIDAQDADIVDAGKARLEGDEQLRDADLKLRVDSGLVTLIGTVPDTRARARAAELVRTIAGVKVVRNELRPKN